MLSEHVSSCLYQGIRGTFCGFVLKLGWLWVVWFLPRHMQWHTSGHQFSASYVRYTQGVFPQSKVYRWHREKRLNWAQHNTRPHTCAHAHILTLHSNMAESAKQCPGYNSSFASLAFAFSCVCSWIWVRGCLLNWCDYCVRLQLSFRRMDSDKWSFWSK